MQSRSSAARTMKRYSGVLVLLITLTLGACASYRDCAPHLTPVTVTAGPPANCRVDGCTLVPDFNFQDCCDRHDARYWIGGTRGERRQADLEFRECIADAGHNLLPSLYYLGVRVAGTPYLPTPWRWGFGWPYPQGYPSQ